MYADTSSTLETVRGESAQPVAVNPELLQRWRQQRDPGQQVAI